MVTWRTVKSWSNIIEYHCHWSLSTMFEGAFKHWSWPRESAFEHRLLPRASWCWRLFPLGRVIWRSAQQPWMNSWSIYGQLISVWPWLTMVDNGWPWLTMVDTYWYCLRVVDNGWWRLTNSDGCASTLIQISATISSHLFQISFLGDAWSYALIYSFTYLFLLIFLFIHLFLIYICLICNSIYVRFFWIIPDLAENMGEQWRKVPSGTVVWLSNRFSTNYVRLPQCK